MGQDYFTASKHNYNLNFLKLVAQSASSFPSENLRDWVYLSAESGLVTFQATDGILSSQVTFRCYTPDFKLALRKNTVEAAEAITINVNETTSVLLDGSKVETDVKFLDHSFVPSTMFNLNGYTLQYKPAAVEKILKLLKKHAKGKNKYLKINRLFVEVLKISESGIEECGTQFTLPTPINESNVDDATVVVNAGYLINIFEQLYNQVHYATSLKISLNESQNISKPCVFTIEHPLCTFSLSIFSQRNIVREKIPCTF